MSDAEHIDQRSAGPVEEEPVQAITIPRSGGGSVSPEMLKALEELGASLEDAVGDDQDDAAD